MEKSTAEVLDQYAIAFIKDEKLNTPEAAENLIMFSKGLDEIKKKYPNVNWDIIVKSFIAVNASIWKYESAIRQGMVDDDLSLVGSRAILVREFNQMRVGLGNVVSSLLNEGLLNYKKDHVSAGND